MTLAAALFAAAAILLAASVWRDASCRLDHALAILDDPDRIARLRAAMTEKEDHA